MQGNLLIVLGLALTLAACELLRRGIHKNRERARILERLQ